MNEEKRIAEIRARCEAATPSKLEKALRKITKEREKTMSKVYSIKPEYHNNWNFLEDAQFDIVTETALDFWSRAWAKATGERWEDLKKQIIKEQLTEIKFNHHKTPESEKREETAKGNMYEYMSYLFGGEYKLTHEATARGYISRKSDGRIEPYKGIYGEGYTVHIPRWDTTQYHTIQYWIKE